MILAAIDIGSNAARLLIVKAAEYPAGGPVDYTKLNLLRVPLRLGFDVFEKGTISPVRRRALLDTMKIYKDLMALYKVEAVRACATSAMRDASNGKAIRRAIKEETGIDLEIITGQEEAAVLYETHIAEGLSARKAYLYIDVGGGSTEVTLFAKGQIVFKESFNIGTIRLLQNRVPRKSWEDMKRYLKAATRDYMPIQAIGTGGNINKVFSVSKRKEGTPLSKKFLEDYYAELKSKTAEQRSHDYGFRDDRADVIVPAMLIYITVMQCVGVNEIYVPKIGLADGLIKTLYAERMAGSDVT